VWTRLYTVPAGHSLIVKSFIVMNNSSVEQNAYAAFAERTGVVTVIYFSEALTLAKGAVLTNWAVLNDGDWLQGYCDSGQVDYWVSGALLPYSVGQVAPALAEADQTVVDAPLPSDVIYLPESNVVMRGTV